MVFEIIITVFFFMNCFLSIEMSDPQIIISGQIYGFLVYASAKKIKRFLPGCTQRCEVNTPLIISKIKALPYIMPFSAQKSS